MWMLIVDLAFQEHDPRPTLVDGIRNVFEALCNQNMQAALELPQELDDEGRQLIKLWIEQGMTFVVAGKIGKALLHVPETVPCASGGSLAVEATEPGPQASTVATRAPPALTPSSMDSAAPHRSGSTAAVSRPLSTPLQTPAPSSPAPTTAPELRVARPVRAARENAGQKRRSPPASLQPRKPKARRIRQASSAVRKVTSEVIELFTSDSEIEDAPVKEEKPVFDKEVLLDWYMAPKLSGIVRNWVSIRDVAYS